MLMLRTTTAPFIVSLTLGSACAQEANPASWYLMPYAQLASSCAEDGGVDLARLRESVEIAGRTASSLVPKDVWSIVSQGLNPSKREPPNAAALEACTLFMKSLAAPDFATQLRQTIAAQGVSVIALNCLVHYPTTVPSMKSDWIAAFRRQGFSIDEKTLDETIGDATPKDPKFTLSPHFPIKADHCKDSAKSLFGPDFDAQYGEAGIRKLFKGR
jgi:hypothetical protein